MLTPQHVFSSHLELILLFSTGIFWILAYLSIIYRGAKDQRCGMPFAALCGNLTWEFMYSFILPHGTPQIYMIYIWFALDLIILTQFVRFSRNDLPAPLSDQWFIPTLLLTLLMALALHYTIAMQFSDFVGVFSAYGLNMMMSLLFVLMLFKRDNLKGQSMSIGLLKLIGTASASFLSYSYFPSSILLAFLYLSTFFFDLTYVILLYVRIRKEKIPLT